MNLKNRFLAAAAVVAVAGAAIYGSTFEISSEEKSRPTWFNNNEETIYFWYSEEGLSEYINSAAVAFSEKENVRVIPVLTSENAYLEAINKASMEEEQAPDAYLVGNESLEKAYLAGLAAEISDEGGICSEQYFPQAALSAVTYHGKKVGYPLCYETSVLVYNADYLQEWAQQNEKENFLDALPSTIDDILNIAETYETPEGVEGVMEWDVSDIFYNYWVVGNYMIVGGDAGDDKENIRINNEETIRCLEIYEALNQFFFIESDSVTYDGVVQDFIDGKIVFTIGTTDIVKRLENAKADGSFAHEYGLITMPDVSGELASRSLSVTNVVAVNGYSTKKELANRFAAYLTKDYAGSLYERSGRVPASSEANAMYEPLRVFAMEYGKSIPMPKMMETANFWIKLEIVFSKVWNGADVTEQVVELENGMQM
ncbi:MAG: extracellular solute-binding protein [Lachnoclostridium sp.]|nr:extracellular solute-binding protein [Lachnospira sp.]MCM1247492.1 extracellular solute-binding protein [Lachnoclostridium sp.]